LECGGAQEQSLQQRFLDVLWNHDIFGIAESWAGQEVYETNGFISFFERKNQGDEIW
jgi:hypothetical protein